MYPQVPHNGWARLGLQNDLDRSWHDALPKVHDLGHKIRGSLFKLWCESNCSQSTRAMKSPGRFCIKSDKLSLNELMWSRSTFIQNSDKL